MPEDSVHAEDKQKMEEILRTEAIGHLGLAADGEVYIVPLNHTYLQGRILFHCALEGKKLDMIRANPSVCFEVSRQEGRPAPHGDDSCNIPFESVICWGRARIIEDLQERQDVLNAFQARYDSSDKTRPPVSMERVKGCGAVEITVTRMTGRKWAPGDDQPHWEWEDGGPD